MKSFQELREKAVSQQQQKLMGLALAYKRGEASDDEVSDQVKKMADSMSTKDLEDFAKTKHKDLPKKVDEYGGPPISRKDYLKQKPMEESKDVEKAVQIAKDMGGNMTGAHKKIEKISKGLSKHPKVKNALRMANEMKENIEDRMPASPDEKRMAIKQSGEGKSFWNLRERSRNARSDARSAMQDDPDMKQKFSKNVSATDDDRKAADKNIIAQLRRVSDLPKGGEVEFKSGKKTKVSQKDAKKLLKGFDGLRKGPDKERFQKMAGKDPAGLKKVMNLVK